MRGGGRKEEPWASNGAMVQRVPLSRRSHWRQKKAPRRGGAFLNHINQVLQLANIFSSRTLGATDNIKTDPITLRQRLETFALDRGMMDENILATVLFDKTKSFCIVKPFYFSFRHLKSSFVLGSAMEPIATSPNRSAGNPFVQITYARLPTHVCAFVMFVFR